MKPGRRLGVTDVAKKQRIIFQCHHFLTAEIFGMGMICLAFAVQAEASNLRRPAEQILDIKRLGGRLDLLQ